MWWYGASHYPALFNKLPPTLQARATEWAKNTEGTTLLDPRLSISKNVDTLGEYVAEFRRPKPFSISSFIGSYDILYPGLRDMHRKLSSMDKSAVVEDLTIASEQGSIQLMPGPRIGTCIYGPPDARD